MNKNKFLRILYKLKLDKKPANLCPYCKQIRKTRVSSKYNRIYFKICNHYVNPLRKTPLFKTRVPIQKWITFLLVFDSSHSVSSKTAGKLLGVSSRQGYNCIRKIRKLMRIKRFKRCRNVQIDELFLGSPKRWNHQQKDFNDEYKAINEGNWKKKRQETWQSKSVIYGLASSNGEYILIDSGIKVSGSQELKKKPMNMIWIYVWNVVLEACVDKDQTVYHDKDSIVTKFLKEKGLSEDSVNHSKAEYVKGVNGEIITTNAVEGIFGRFKRSFKGTHTFAKKHLQLYLNDWAFKNTYKFKNFEGFIKILFM